MAPSPTGALHLGNARTFLITWAIARRAGWVLRMRIEDLDGPRIKPGAAESALDVLAWLGLDWDGPVLTQSNDLSPYRASLEHLANLGRIFPCGLSRREIEEAASAPHGRSRSIEERLAGAAGAASTGEVSPAGGTESRYPPELRPPSLPTTVDWSLRVNWRFVVPDEPVEFVDGFAGSQSINPQATIGDFIVWTRIDQPAYQLAVVVDDARQGVTDVIRGDDLLDSAARQMLLIRALGLAPEPRYVHLPLVIGPDGRRLAKRHGDTRLTAYRDAGVPPERVVGLIASWSGVCRRPEPMTASEFAGRFDLARLPTAAAVFTPAEEAWLRRRS